ncbi:hypothetical protein ZG45_003754 [Salmonella enterica subsp. enterica]|nr:hypothetical protein EI690_01730 [Klebsiella pneumoniae]EAT3715742.1 hypothetical protein [Salmonella enterica]EBU7841925.1 hypothetical protein [Salmonella enterica subsp. enterica serovar Stanley]EDC7983919.1 hypothetical protein [Salmonella enterica subsp. enterica serovar Montevideo]EDV0669515.1 hypothetical protein [Salmonella enterica subsp. enterica]ELW7335643.1 hypothetical protein [Yersinia enterocolitica]HAX7883142.1 hypothetical protein [Escherichia coli]HBQ6989216.1 hypothetic
MMKKQLIAGVMLVVAHAAGAAQGDDTDLQQIYTEAGIQGICSAGMLTVPEEARDEIVPQNVRRLLVQCAYFDEQQLRRRAGLPVQTFDHWRDRHAVLNLSSDQVSDALWLSAWRDFRAQLASAYPATAEKKVQGEEAVPASTKPGTEHGSAAD